MFAKGIKNIAIRIGNKISVILGFGVECNICGSRFRRFASDDWHQFVGCWRCGSQIRQRLFVAALDFHHELNSENILRSKTVLHFAPDKCLKTILKKESSKYMTADFMSEGYFYENIDHNLDISKMPSIQDESIDLVIAFDVLEHVPDHLAALREVIRILKPGGYCSFTIPQKDGLEKTFEDSTVSTPEQRKEIYGQWDHLRIYGSDFSGMMKDAGFAVTIVDEKEFNEKLVKRHVLFPPVLSANPLATNYRKVYFGRK